MRAARSHRTARRRRLRVMFVLLVVGFIGAQASRGNGNSNGNNGIGNGNGNNGNGVGNTRACDASVESQVKGTAAFQSCFAATNLNLDQPLKNKDDIDPTRAAFCSSKACLQVYLQLRSIGGLYCLTAYSTTQLPLYQESGGVTCFGAAAFEPATSPPTDAPSPSIAEEPTELPSEAPSPSSTPLPDEDSASTAGDSISSPEASSTAPNVTVDSPETTPATAPSTSPGASESKTSQSNVNVSNESGSQDQSSPLRASLLVVTGLLVVALAGVACFVYYRRLSTPESVPPLGPSYVRPAKSTRQQRTASTTHDGSTSCESSRTSMQSHSMDVWACEDDSLVAGNDEIINSCRLPFEKLVFGEQLSQGGFGVVFCGSYRGQIVAIKTLLPEHRKSAKHIHSFLNEIRLLASLEHERIVQFIGVAWDSLNEISVVMEFMERGDLRTLLNEYDASGVQARGFDAHKVQIALHIVHALAYLHSLEPVVLHRDLKSRNILLDGDLNAKLTDFGVSRERSECTMTAGVGSSLWMAPEVMLGERYDEKADIFSFGVVLSEIDLHSSPYSHARESQSNGRRLPDTAILQMVSMGMLAVAFTDEEHCAIAKLGRECVAVDPTERPTVGDVLHRLHVIHHATNEPGAFV